MAPVQMKDKYLGTNSMQAHNQGAQFTLLELLTQWSDPNNPCVASRKVLEVFRSQQELPLWSSEGGELLLEHVVQAIELRSPGILNLLELLQEYAKSRQLEEHEEDQDEEEEEGSLISYVVMGYALLCLFVTGEVEEDSSEEWLNCVEFVRQLTFFFKMLLEYWKGAMVRQANLVGKNQLTAVVDSRQSIFYRRNVLKDLNDLLTQMNSSQRSVLRHQCGSLFMKVPQLLEEVGDYDMQASLVELLYRLTSSADRTRYVTRWFPGLDCTVQSLFLTITEFDPHCRRFLNAYNASLGPRCMVHTLPCHVATIGKLKLCKPQNPSYPKLWVDFNLGYPSVLVTCQLEGQATVNNLWECLFLMPEEVQSVTLTCHMHTYTMELLYSSVEKVQDLFTSPLSQESHAKLSNMMYLEFSPLQMLKELCLCIFGSKLLVTDWQPEGWKANGQGKGQSGATSSSSSTKARMSSGVLGNVEIEPDLPADPGSGAHNGTLAPPLTFTQSIVKTSQKNKKTSVVFSECEEYDGKELQACLINGPSKPQKSASSTKRHTGSGSLLYLSPNNLAEINDKEANRTLSIDEDEEPAHQKTSKSKGKTKFSTSNKKRKGQTKISLVRHTTDTSQSSQVSPHYYKPLNFTSPRPGAAMLRGRTPRKGKTLGCSTDVTRDEEEEQSPTPIIKRNKPQSTMPDSKDGKVQKSDQIILKDEMQQEEADVFLPGSEESLVVGKGSKKAAANASDVFGVNLEAWNTKQDPGSHAKVEMPPHTEQETKTSSCTGNKTKAPPHLTMMSTLSSMDHEMKTSPCTEHSMDTPNFSGFSNKGSNTKLSNRQTRTPGEKDSEGVKKNTRRSSSRNEQPVTNSTPVKKEARKTRKQASKRPSVDLKSINDAPSKGNIKNKAGSTVDAKTSPTSAIISRTIDKADPIQTEEENVKSQEADLPCSIKAHIVELSEFEAAQNNPDSTILIISESPGVEPHLKVLSHAQKKEYSADTVITNHAHGTPGGTKPTETGSLQDKSLMSQPGSRTHDKHNYTKPDASPAPTADISLRHETHTEEDAVHSNLAILRESPIPSGQVYEEKLFESDPIDEDTGTTTEPFIEPLRRPDPIDEDTGTTTEPFIEPMRRPDPVDEDTGTTTEPFIEPMRRPLSPVTTLATVIAQSPSPSPQDRQLQVTGSIVPKDVDDQCISTTPLETKQMELPNHKSIPETPHPPLPQDKNMEAAASDSQSSLRPAFLANVIAMSPLLLMDTDTPAAVNNDPQAPSGGGEETSAVAMDRQVEENAEETSVLERVQVSVHETCIGSEKVQHELEEVASLKQEGKLVEEESADKTNSRSVTSGLSKDSNVSENDGPELITHDVLGDRIFDNKKRSCDKSVTRKPESPLLGQQEQHAKKRLKSPLPGQQEQHAKKRLKSPLLGQQEQHAKKGTPYKRNKKGTCNNRSRKHTTSNTRGKDQAASCQSLISQGATLPTSRPSTHRIRNKHLLFDPDSQFSVMLSPHHQQLTEEEKRQKTLETNQDKADTFKDHGKLTPYDSRLQNNMNEMTDRTETHSSGKKRKVSRDKSNDRGSSGGKGKRKCKPSFIRKSSGFMEDSGLEEEEPHSIFSDLEASPNTKVDIWFLHRMEKIQHHKVTYSNTSSSRLSLKEEREQTVKKRKSSTKDDKNNSPSNTSLAIEGLSDNNRCSNPPKSPLSSFTTAKDTSENAHNYSLLASRPQMKGRNRKSSRTLVWKSTSTSEVSQTSSHDEWEPPSTKKKTNLPEKEDTKFSRSKFSRSRSTGRKQISKDGNTVDDSRKHMDTSSPVLADHSDLQESSVEALRHTSRSSLDSSAPNFMNFKLAASKEKETRKKNVRTEDKGDPRYPSALSQASQPFSPQPQKSDPQVSSPVQESPATQTSTPVLFLESPAFDVLSLPPQEDSPSQELCIPPATDNQQNDFETNQLELQDDQMSEKHHNTSTSVLKTTQVMVTTAATLAPTSTQPFRADSEESHHPSHLSSMDISAILVPGSDTQAPPSGPLQSTMFDSLVNKPTSPAPRFSYISEAEASYVEKEHGIRGKDSASHKSPSSNEPIRVELWYDKNQTLSLVTTTTTAELHQADTPDEPMNLLGVTSPGKTQAPERNQQIEPPSHPSEVFRSTVRETEKPQTNLPRIQSVTPTAKVPPQSANLSVSSRMYRQPLQTQQTPLSRHESPVHPQSRNLFGAVRGEAADGEERSIGAHRTDLMRALVPVQAELERMSGSFYRGIHTLATFLTLIVERLSDREAP